MTDIVKLKNPYRNIFEKGITFMAALVRFLATACRIFFGDVSEALPILRYFDPGWMIMMLEESTTPVSSAVISDPPPGGIEMFVSTI